MSGLAHVGHWAQWQGAQKEDGVGAGLRTVPRGLRGLQGRAMGCTSCGCAPPPAPVHSLSDSDPLNGGGMC